MSKQKEIILDSGFDQTNGRVVMFGPENKELVEEIGMEKAVYGSAYVRDEPKKPSLRDNAFVIGALVVTILTTISSFIWGLF